MIEYGRTIEIHPSDDTVLRLFSAYRLFMMGLTAEAIKNFVNRLLAPANVRIESLTAERVEARRLNALVQSGHFEKPVYEAFRPNLLADTAKLLKRIEMHRPAFEKFLRPELNDVAYSFANAYFSSPDTEILYAMIEMYRPMRIVEVGSGNSTKVMRQAILDHALDTKITAIDPSPRVDVRQYADEVRSSRVEELDPWEVAGWLESGDILFIDSSHIIGLASDVSFLYFQILPKLKPGVLIHAHDIFLPYEYPKEWVIDHKWRFNEQTVLNALLAWSNDFSILWPGHFLQRSNPNFDSLFPHASGRRAQSFWMKREA